MVFMVLVAFWIIPIVLGFMDSDKKGTAAIVLPVLLGWIGYIVSLFLPYTPEYIKKNNEK